MGGPPTRPSTEEPRRLQENRTGLTWGQRVQVQQYTASDSGQGSHRGCMRLPPEGRRFCMRVAVSKIGRCLGVAVARFRGKESHKAQGKSQT